MCSGWFACKYRIYALQTCWRTNSVVLVRHEIFLNGWKSNVCSVCHRFAWWRLFHPSRDLVTLQVLQRFRWKVSRRYRVCGESKSSIFIKLMVARTRYPQPILVSTSLICLSIAVRSRLERSSCWLAGKETKDLALDRGKARPSHMFKRSLAVSDENDIKLHVHVI